MKGLLWIAAAIKFPYEFLTTAPIPEIPDSQYTMLRKNKKGHTSFFYYLNLWLNSPKNNWLQYFMINRNIILKKLKNIYKIIIIIFFNYIWSIKFQTWDHENVYNLCGVGKCIETHAKIKYNPNDILKWEYKWFTKKNI